MIRSLVRFWRRASFCVSGVHFELSSAEMPMWEGSNARPTCFCTKTIAKYNGCFKGTHVYSTWPVCKRCVARACAYRYLRHSRSYCLDVFSLSVFRSTLEHAEIATCLSPQLNLATQALRPHASEATTDTHHLTPAGKA